MTIETAEWRYGPNGEKPILGPQTESFLDHPQPVDISVVIVNWNTCDLTLQCLRSVSAQIGMFSSQIIVVDNGSEDGSVEAIRVAFPSVTVIANKQNLGFAKANNQGLCRCVGQYIFLINSDVVLRDECIALLYRYMEERREIGMLGPRILNGDLTLQESCKEFPTLWNSVCRALALDSAFPNVRCFSSQLMRYWSHDDVRLVDILSGCFWVVRREALEAVGCLDERFFMYAEDKDWCKRFWKAGWPVVYYPVAEAIHLVAASSGRDPVRFYIEMNRANLLYWTKHHGRIKQFIFRWIMLLHETLRIFGETAIWIMRPSQKHAAQLKLRRSSAAVRTLLFGHFPSVGA